MKRICTILFVALCAVVPAEAQPQLIKPLPPRVVGPGGLTFDLAEFLTVPGIEISDPVVQVVTPLGTFSMELLWQDAPLTVENFLSYVRDGIYRNVLVHRSVRNFVLQSGGFTATLPPVPVSTRAPVANEFRVPNTRGTVAMAKVGGNPDSATSQWFVNLADNRANLDNQNGGFTVFARVLGEGMDVVDALAGVPVYNAGAPFDELPLRDFRSEQTRVEMRNLLPIEGIYQGPFATRSSDSRAWSVALEGSVLTIRPGPEAKRPATVTVRAADRAGRVVIASFVVKGSRARRYAGVGMGPDGPVSSSLDLTPAGAYSGTLQFSPRAVWRGRGSLDLVEGNEVVAGTSPDGAAIVLAYGSGSDFVRVFFRKNGIDSASFDLHPVVWPDSSGAPSPLDRRVVNALLARGAQGYLQFRFDRLGVARVSGRLADGTTITGAVPTVTGDQVNRHRLPLAVFPSRGDTASLAGILTLSLAGEGTTLSAALGEVLDRRSLSSSATSFAVAGALWRVPDRGINALSGLPTETAYRLDFEEAALSGLPDKCDGIWPASNRPAPPQGGVVGSMKFNASSGLLTGRLVVPAAGGSGKASTLPFSGLLTGPLVDFSAAFRGGGFVSGPDGSSASWSLRAH